MKKNLLLASLIALSCLLTGTLSAQISSASSGSWSATTTWVGGVVPTSTVDAVISAGHTVTVDDATAACFNVTFGDATSKIAMGAATSVLSVYGNFTLFSTAHVPFSSWEPGAKLKFTGDAAIQSLVNISTSSPTAPPTAAFMEVVVDKSAGKVTTPSTGGKWSLGTSLEIINGTFELGTADDIYGRDLTGAATWPTITVQSGGTFDMLGGATQINSGTGSGGGPIGKLTVYGTANLATTSTASIRFGDIDVENGGTVRLVSFGTSASYLYLVPGTVTVKNGGTLRYTSTSARIWDTSSNVILESGSFVNITAAGVITLPATLTDNGATWRYSLAGNQTGVLERTYTNLEISGSGIKTLAGSPTITGTLFMLGSANLALSLGNFDLILGPLTTVSGTITPANMIVTNGTGSLKRTWTGAQTSEFPIGVGITATGTATQTGGVVTALAVTNGGGVYLTEPTVTITGGGATTDATATATITNGIVTVLTITSPGAGYTSSPTVTISSPRTSYTPVVITNSAANTIAARVSPTITNPVTTNSKVVQLEWLLSESTPGSNSGTATFQWNAVDAGVDFDIAKTVSIGIWNSSTTSYDLQDIAVSGTGPYTINYTLPATLKTGPVVIGNRDGFGTATRIDDSPVKNLKVYPNPAKDVLNIESNITEAASIEIYDMTGRKIQTRLLDEDNTAVNVASLPKGMYMVKVKGSGKMVTGKFIKN
jgi:hypothetical protein